MTNNDLTPGQNMTARNRKNQSQFFELETLELRLLLSSDGFDLDDDDRLENELDDDEDSERDDVDRRNGFGEHEDRDDDDHDDDDHDDEDLTEQLEETNSFETTSIEDAETDSVFAVLATNTDDFGVTRQTASVDENADSELTEDLSAPTDTTAEEPDTSAESDGNAEALNATIMAEAAEDSPTASSEETNAIASPEDREIEPLAVTVESSSSTYTSEIVAGEVVGRADSTTPNRSEPVAAMILESSSQSSTSPTATIELIANPFLNSALSGMKNVYSTTTLSGAAGLSVAVAEFTAALPDGLPFTRGTSTGTARLSVPIALTFVITWLGIKQHRHLRRRTVLTMR